MHLTGFESLRAIISSLTQSETDQIERRFARKSNHKSESRLHILFSLIEKNSIADDQLIFNLWRRKIKSDVTSNAYEKAKSQLKQFILETLRFADVPGHDAYLLERLDFANILAAKGLYAEAYKILQLTEKDALEFTDPLFACIINYKMIQFLPHVPEKDRSQNVHGLLKETGDMLTQLKTYHEIFSFNLEIAMLARQTSFVKSKKQTAQLKSLLHHPLTAIDPVTLPYIAKCTLLKSLSWLYRLSNDLKAAYTVQAQLVQFFSEKENYHMQYRPAQYLAELADLINISIKNGLTAEAETALHKYRQICSKYSITDTHTHLVIQNYELLIQLEDQKKVIDTEMLNNQWKMINSKSKPIQPGHLLVFTLTVMKCFLAQKNYKKLHDAYILILKTAPAERFDVLFTAELIYTLSIYEQSHIDTSLQLIESNIHFGKQALSLYRRITASADKTESDNITALCLKALAEKQSISDHIKILQKLKTGMQKIASKEDTQPIFNIIQWAGAQLQILEPLEIKKGGKKLRRPVLKVS